MQNLVRYAKSKVSIENKADDKTHYCYVIKNIVPIEYSNVMFCKILF